MKPLNELRKLIQGNHLAGLQTRQKYYAVSGTLTTANISAPLSLTFKVDDSEFFWVTGLRGSFRTLAAPNTLGEPFIQIINVFTQEAFVRTEIKVGSGNTKPGYANFSSVMAPGGIPNTIPTAPNPALQDITKVDMVLTPQQQVQVNILAPAALANNEGVEVLFIGFSQRLQR